METSESDVLVIQGESGSEELIPALRSVLIGWDAESRVLTVRWPMDGQE
jgi:ribosomal 30S subunit maturation factor RimM